VISSGTAGTVGVVNQPLCSPVCERERILRPSTYVRLLLLVTAIWLCAFLSPSKLSAASATAVGICDPAADHFLAIEDYPESIRLHREVLKTQPSNPLTYYHLGFSYGMLHDQANEIRAYQRAIALGLVRWDLFLNMGLAYLQTDDLDDATRSLQLAALLGPEHPESHFNLALVYERRGMFDPAKREILVSLWLDPQQPDARNMLGVIYAEQGDKAGASDEWRDLLQDSPRYLPARTNLAILNTKNTVDTPQRESQPVEVVSDHSVRALHSSTTGIQH
jgi:tetratricopeptide (TPR) repeat protein